MLAGVSVVEIHASGCYDNTDKHIVIRTHFFPPLVGIDSPWNHAPMKIVIPPEIHPACQSSGLKKAVAIRATPSIAKMFDQYLSIPFSVLQR